MPNEVHVVEGPQGFALLCAGDPNGAIIAPKGTLAIDNVTPAIWQNTNGVTTWVQVGTGGGSGFPITEDDGTNTFTIDVAPGQLVESNVLDADNNFFAQQILNAAATLASAETDVGVTGANAVFAVALDQSALDVAPFQFSWAGESASIGIFAGDPNGNVTAPEGSICLDTTTPALWQNTDGATAWIVTTGGSGFPVGPFDDGTNTYEIAAAAGVLIGASLVDATAERAATSTIATTNSATVELDTLTGAHAAALQVIADAASARAVLTFDGTPVHMLQGVADPNTVVTAPKASMFFDTNTGNIYRNTDGATAWTAM